MIGFQNIGVPPEKKWKLWEKAADGKITEHQHKGEQKQSGFNSGPKGKFIYQNVILMPIGVAPDPIQPGTNLPASNIRKALETMQPITTKDGNIQFVGDKLVLAERTWKAYTD